MESTDKPTPESGKTSETNAVHLLIADISLRILLFVATLTAVLVMVTSKQTLFTLLGSQSAKFNYSPAFIYFVVALSVACLYSILTTIASLWTIWKPCPSKKLLFHFLLIDVLMVGVVASATGAAGGVAYIGLKGNSHVGWMKVCSIFDKFCRHIGSSVAISLFASVLLVLLVMLSAFTLYSRSR